MNVILDTNALIAYNAELIGRGAVLAGLKRKIADFLLNTENLAVFIPRIVESEFRPSANRQVSRDIKILLRSMDEIGFERQVTDADFLMLDGVFLDFPNLSLADALLVAYSRKHGYAILTEDKAIRRLKGMKKPLLAV